MTYSTSKDVRTRQATRSTVASLTKNDLQSRNFLQPQGFRFQVARSPKVTFFGNSVNIPGITLRTITQTTPGLKDIDLPGEIIDFEDLTLRFLVDENLQNYQEIQNWIRGLGFPESLQEIYDLQNEDVGTTLRTNNQSPMNLYSDGTLTILDAMQIENFKVKFQDLFPYSLSTIQFDATLADTEYFTAEVSFKYLNYKIVKGSGFV
jgi:Tfp pilus assembly ATPase PilU